MANGNKIKFRKTYIYICDGKKEKLKFMHGLNKSKLEIVCLCGEKERDIGNGKRYSACFLTNWNNNNFTFSLFASFVSIFGWFLTTDALGITKGNKKQTKKSGCKKRIYVLYT